MKDIWLFFYFKYNKILIINLHRFKNDFKKSKFEVIKWDAKEKDWIISKAEIKRRKYWWLD
jgi:hypothetical protein